jgi:nitronate monooxygenase
VIATVPREIPQLRHPIVQAPMAGGPSTPELTIAVSNAGGLGFLAAGYRTAQQVQDDIVQTEAAVEGSPFGVNLFYATEVEIDDRALRSYARAIQPEAERHGVSLGKPHFDDDGLHQKLAVVRELRVPIVSFTFGCPAPAVIGEMQADGISVWVTVTEPDEARAAVEAGADALICQGVEAGGHRGSFVDDDGVGELGLLSLLQLVGAITDSPLIASGGIMDGRGIAAVLAAGASAAQLGTAFMLCPEAGTNESHRLALTRPGATAITRAFSGRRARGIVNRFMRDHDALAPSAYPQVNQLTSPLRAAAREVGDTDAINLWAGQAYPLAQARPAADLIELWSEQLARV